jgi:hypothetical protein
MRNLPPVPQFTNLPDPDVLALEIAEELEAVLERFSAIAEDLKR